MLVPFRFLNGFVITFLTLGPSIVGDLFVKEKRGAAMAVATVLPLLGPVAAPAVGSFTAQAKGWRWTIWIIVIAVGAVTSFSLLIFRETNKVTILQYKTKHLRKERGNDHLRPKYEVATGRGSFIRSTKRPLTMLYYHPVIFIISLYTAVIYGFSYLSNTNDTH